MSRQPTPLTDIAPNVLTDVVLLRMVAYGHVLGPYRPSKTIVRDAFSKMGAAMGWSAIALLLLILVVHFIAR